MKEIYADYKLAIRHQQFGKVSRSTVALKIFSKECNYKSVTAAIYFEESIYHRLVFIPIW